MVPDYALDSRPLDSWVRSLGDFNGDGYDDIYHYETNPSDILDVFFGSEDFDTIPDWVRYSDANKNILPTAHGDINGDGYEDFTAGPLIPERGIYFGSSDPDTLVGQSWNVGSLGATISADLNNDGKDDIAVLGTSAVNIYWGGDVVSEVPDAVLDFHCNDGGTSFVNSAGDFNGDGYEDLVVVDYACNSGFGRIALFAGGPYIRTTPVWEENGSVNGLMVGIYNAVGVGDINNDGIEDLAVGCQNGFNRRGRVVIFSGDTTMILPAEEAPPIVDSFSLSVYPNPANGNVKIEIAGNTAFRAQEVEIYNLLGRRVVTLNSLTGSFDYDVANLSTGIYLVHAEVEDKFIAQKLIVLK